MSPLTVLELYSAARMLPSASALGSSLAPTAPQPGVAVHAAIASASEANEPRLSSWLGLGQGYG